MEFSLVAKRSIKTRRLKFFCLSEKLCRQMILFRRQKKLAQNLFVNLLTVHRIMIIKDDCVFVLIIIHKFSRFSWNLNNDSLIFLTHFLCSLYFNSDELLKIYKHNCGWQNIIPSPSKCNFHAHIFACSKAMPCL